MLKEKKNQYKLLIHSNMMITLYMYLKLISIENFLSETSIIN
jgi:hypothetical protein